MTTSSCACNAVKPHQLPRGWRKNPAGNVTRIKREQRRLRKALREVQAWLDGRIDRIPVQQVNALHINRYEYLIDMDELERIVAELAVRLGDLPNDLLVDAVVAAYRQGTGDEVANLAAITSAYTRAVTQVIQSDPWQRRVALIQARVFEEMEGFEGETARELGRVLRRAVEDGKNSGTLKDLLAERFGVAQSRAERIARTEIVGAYRRARWDEDQDANERLGVKTGLLWISAFAPNTRTSHAALNGKVVTQDFVRDFYSRDANGINCMCSQSSVLLDDDGSPTQPDVIARVKSAAPATEGEGID